MVLFPQRDWILEESTVMEKAIEILKLAWPLLAIELGIRVWCITLIARQGVRTLSKLAWGLIVGLISIFGWVTFLMWGRKTA